MSDDWKDLCMEGADRHSGCQGRQANGRKMDVD